MPKQAAFAAATTMALMAMAAPACAQTCLDHDFSGETEFFISSSGQNAGYRNFILGDYADKAIYWTRDVDRLIRSLQADEDEWRSTDDTWSANAVAIEFTDGGYQCRAAIDNENLYANAGNGGGQYVRSLRRSERNQIMSQLNDITRMTVQ
ncbi:hypothetical protein ACFOOP_14995 [Marinicaulis aureus]|uniref:Uncharacterized protein n=1 Tax=Hyphococcus aureus TaxID=2666033 RepID=A0ABW1L1L1_9PROT